MSNLIKLNDCTYIDCPECGKRKLISYPVTVSKYVHKTHKGNDLIYYCSHTCKMKAVRRKQSAKTAYNIKLQQHVKPRKKYTRTIEGKAKLAATREHNTNVLGKAFWQDWLDGLLYTQIAEKYGKSLSFVKKWSKAYREVMAL